MAQRETLFTLLLKKTCLLHLPFNPNTQMILYLIKLPLYTHCIHHRPKQQKIAKV